MRVWLLLVLLVGLVILVRVEGWRVPDRFDPWAPLDLAAEPDMFLRFKLGRLGDEPRQCLAAIGQAGATFSPLADHEEPGGCGWTNAVRLSALDDTRLATPVMLTCPMVASLVLFNRRVLQPEARTIYGEPVRTIDHVGSYACRNVYHRDQAPLSRHARADAFDITGVRLADGRRIGVEDGWNSAADGPYLHRLQADGCRFFGAFLGPDYNAAHRTHFHLQGAGYRFCR